MSIGLSILFGYSFILFYSNKEGNSLPLFPAFSAHFGLESGQISFRLARERGCLQRFAAGDFYHLPGNHFSLGAGQE